jgi:tetratricopeptide (TPR) repeat protein
MLVGDVEDVDDADEWEGQVACGVVPVGRVAFVDAETMASWTGPGGLLPEVARQLDLEGTGGWHDLLRACGPDRVVVVVDGVHRAPRPSQVLEEVLALLGHAATANLRVVLTLREGLLPLLAPPLRAWLEGGGPAWWKGRAWRVPDLSTSEAATMYRAAQKAAGRGREVPACQTNWESFADHHGWLRTPRRVRSWMELHPGQMLAPFRGPYDAMRQALEEQCRRQQGLWPALRRVADAVRVLGKDTLDEVDAAQVVAAWAAAEEVSDASWPNPVQLACVESILTRAGDGWTFAEEAVLGQVLARRLKELVVPPTPEAVVQVTRGLRGEPGRQALLWLVDHLLAEGQYHCLPGLVDEEESRYSISRALVARVGAGDTPEVVGNRARLLVAAVPEESRLAATDVVLTAADALLPDGAVHAAALLGPALSAVRALHAEDPEDPDLVIALGQFLLASAQALESLGEVPPALRLVQEVRSLVEPMHRRSPGAEAYVSILARAHYAYARLLVHAGNPEGAQAALELCIALEAPDGAGARRRTSEEARRQAHNFAMALSTLGQVQGRMGAWEPCVHTLERAVTAWEAARDGAPDDRRVAEELCDVYETIAEAWARRADTGSVTDAMGDPLRESAGWRLRALRALRDLGRRFPEADPDRRRLFEAHHRLGTQFSLMGDGAGLARHLGRAAVLGRKLLEKDGSGALRPRLAETHASLAHHAEKRGQAATAAAQWKTAANLLADAQEMDPANRYTATALCDTLREAGAFSLRVDEADLAQAYVSMEAEHRTLVAQESPDDRGLLFKAVGCHQRAARVFRDCGDTPHALAHLHRAHQWAVRAVAMEPDDTTRHLDGQLACALGTMLVAQGELELGKDALEGALDTLADLGRPSLSFMDALSRLFLVNRALGQVTEPPPGVDPDGRNLPEPEVGGMPPLVQDEVAARARWAWCQVKLATGAWTAEELPGKLQPLLALAEKATATVGLDFSDACSIASTWRDGARALSLLGRDDEALDLLNRCALLLDPRVEKLPAGHRVVHEHAGCLEQIAAIRLRRGDAVATTELLERATWELERAVQADNANAAAQLVLAGQQFTLAGLLLRDDEAPRAGAQVGAALQLLVRLFQREPDRLDLREKLRDALSCASRVQEAMGFDAEALATATRALQQADALCAAWPSDDAVREKMAQCAVRVARLLDD